MGMRAAFEFRDASWFDDEIFQLLKTKNLALCLADSDKLATPIVATADYGYLRLRREDYQDADVARWSNEIKAKEGAWSDAFVYFKHEERHRAKAGHEDDGAARTSRLRRGASV